MRRTSQIAAALIVLLATLGLPAVSRAADPTIIDGGTLATDTTWTAAASPYKLTKGLEIPVGITLTIEPGVVIENEVSSADSSKPLFLVNGSVSAVGTALNPITIRKATYSAAFGSPTDTTPAAATGAITLSHVDLSGKLLQFRGEAMASIDISDSLLNVPNESMNLGLTRSVSVVRTALWLGNNSTYALSLAPGAESLTFHHNRIRAGLVGCSGTGTLVLRDNTFEIMSSDAWDDGSGVRTYAGCGVDARDNFWETTGSLESRNYDGIDAAGLPIADVSTRLTTAAAGTPTMVPGYFAAFLQIRTSPLGSTAQWPHGPTGGLPTSYRAEALPAGVWDVPEQTAETTGSYVVFQNLDETKSYRIRVTAHNALGDGSSTTSDLFTPVAPAVAPPAPAVSVQKNGNPVTFAWTDNGNGGDEFAAWDWELTTGATVTSGSVGGGNRSVDIWDLTPGATYTFSLRGVNGIGPGEPGETTFVAQRVPQNPTSLKTTRGDRSALVSWAAPTPNTGYPLTGFRVRNASTGAIVTTNAAARSLRISGLTNGKRYQFQLQAFNAHGSTAWSSPMTVTPAGKPGHATGVKASARTNAAKVTWKAAPANGAAVTSYRITASNGKSVVVRGSARSVVFKRLKRGVSYRFTVIAINSVGAGTSSARSNAIRPR